MNVAAEPVQGRATLYSLLGDGGNHDGGDTSPRVRTPMPSSLALTSLIRRRLMALTVRSRRPVALGGLDDAVAAVSLQSKCVIQCALRLPSPPRKSPAGAGQSHQSPRKRGPWSGLMPGKSPAELGWGLARVRTSTHTIAACSPVWLPNRNGAPKTGHPNLTWSRATGGVCGPRLLADDREPGIQREHRVVEPRQRCDTHTSEPMHRILRFYV
jgi:hypothetical protein